MGGAAGPVLTGRIYDVTGSYRLAFALHVGVLIAAAAEEFLYGPDIVTCLKKMAE